MKLSVKLLLAAAVVLGLMTAAAADQSISWVSVSPLDNGGAGSVAVSDDGRYVAFVSTADLVPGDTDNSDVFVRDMQTGAMELISVSSGGVRGNSNSGSGANSVDISADGRYAVFISNADNLVAGDDNERGDAFIRDRVAGTTTRVLGDVGQQGGAVANVAISGNGRYVAFNGAGYEDGMPANSWAVLVFDRTTGLSERVTDGVSAFSDSNVDVDISDDGRYVAFKTGEFGAFADIILFDRNTDTWEVANPRLGNERPQSSHPQFLSLSGDGRYVAFSSPDTNYVAGDPADTNDVFVYDAVADSVERIPGGGATVSQDPNPVISGDGRYVAFTAGLDIYGAANGRADVVVYDRQADSGEVVSVYDDGSPGDRSSGSYLHEPAISRDGRFVAFTTEAGFDPDDNSAVDVYRVDREGTTGPPPPGDGECSHDFSDVDSSNVFEDDICWLAAEGITRGCNPPANTEFCPKDPVTRGQMAAFLVRALGYTDDGGGDLFTDDDSSVFEGDIDRLGTAGVTRGCNPPANSEFCPTEHVTRGQMAAFLVRALGYSDDGGGDLFTDDDSSVFEADIDRLGTAGVTRGCNPPTNDRFCPTDNVTREQMAAFLRRALDG
ncbi:MAG TPA: S-layer homology domain-containing protein [Acidimicrobiia bacterium]|nr:S-layer homology domain-containing protein [Acidimicrobiia bacterium]